MYQMSCTCIVISVTGFWWSVDEIDLDVFFCSLFTPFFGWACVREQKRGQPLLNINKSVTQDGSHFGIDKLMKMETKNPFFRSKKKKTAGFLYHNLISILLRRVQGCRRSNHRKHHRHLPTISIRLPFGLPKNQSNFCHCCVSGAIKTYDYGQHNHFSLCIYFSLKWKWCLWVHITENRWGISHRILCGEQRGLLLFWLVWWQSENVKLNKSFVSMGALYFSWKHIVCRVSVSEHSQAESDFSLFCHFSCSL